MTPPEAVEKQHRVAVRNQILDHLRDQPAILSTGGQPHMLLDADRGHNSFAVPFHSPYLQSWVTMRQRHNPAPTPAQMKQALSIKQTHCLFGSLSYYARPINLRYAWDSDHRIPHPT